MAERKNLLGQVNEEGSMRKFVLAFFLLSALCLLTAASPAGPSRPAMLFKRAPDQVLVWAYDQNSEMPLAGAEVTIYEHGRRVIALGQTDRDGTFTAPINPLDENLLATVRKDGQIASCSESWRGLAAGTQFNRTTSPDRYKVYFHTNHLVYQAGQKVRFWAIIRESDASLPPPSRTPVRIRVVHSAGYVLYDKAPLTDRFGSVSSIAPLPEGIPPGQFFLEAELDGERHIAPFQVMERPGQDYSLRWETAPAGYPGGQDIEAALWASYPGGAPTARLPLRWRLELFTPSAGHRQLAEGMGETDEDGRLKITVPSPDVEAGIITLEAEAVEQAAAPPVRASSAAFFRLKSPIPAADRLLSTDRQTYLPGEEAQIFIKAPCERCTALITVERERILHHQVVELREGSAAVSLTIREDYIPNVFIGVALLPSGGEKPESFLTDYIELAVERQENWLDISIITSKERYRPGEEVDCAILTRDGWGRPVSAELSLAVVEAPGYVLAGKEDISAAWRARLPLKVRTAQSLPAGRAAYEEMPAISDAALCQAETFTLKVASPSSAYWQPRLITDENGEAHISFPISEPGNWRIVAQGVTAEAGRGAAFADIIAEPKLTLHPALPRFLRAGDEVEVGIFLHNWSEEPEEIQLRLVAEGLELSGELTRTATISPGKVARLSWPAVAGSSDSAKVTASAAGPDFADEWRADLPILPFGEIKEAFDSNLAWQGHPGVLAVGLPQGAVSAELEIQICPSLAARLMDELARLKTELYPEPEGLAAYLLAAASLAEAWPEGKDRLASSIEETLEHLHRLQKEDGSWGEDAYSTAFALQALERASQAGFEVRDESLERGRQALQIRLAQEKDPALQAFIFYLLFGQNHAPERTSPGVLLSPVYLSTVYCLLYIKMSPWGRALLALTLKGFGEREAAMSIISDLASQAITTENLARWEGEAFSDRQNTAQVLKAMLALDPENPLLPKAFNWLMHVRWRTPQEKATAISALAAYLASEKPAPAEGPYRILLNGQPLAEGAFPGSDALACQSVATNALETGDNEAQIILEGKGAIYGTALLRYQMERENLEAARSLDGPSVQRRYVKDGQPLTECALGDLIGVEITLDASQAMRQVLVRDSLPAGCEAVNGGMEGGGVWLDTKGDEVAFLIPHLEPGKHTFMYIMRAATAGRFRAMPAEAISLYTPDRWGRSASAELVIGR